MIKRTESRTDEYTSGSCFSCQKEKGAMSFAGFSFVDGNIFMFSDTKGSRVNEFGVVTYDNEKPVVKKQFSNNRMAIAVTGINQIIYNSDDTVVLDVENLIDDYMTLASQPEDVACDLFRLIQENKVYMEGKIFLSAICLRDFSFHKKCVNLIRAEISTNNFSCQTEQIYRNRHYAIGDDRYVNHFSAFPEQIRVNSAEKIKENIEMVVRKMDLLPEYNPVGGEIVVREVTLTETV